MTDTYGIKVSKDGKDISSTTPEDFVLNSQYGSVKIYKQGSGTITISGSGTATLTVSHSLGFVPMVMLYTEPTPNSGKWRFGIFFAQSEDTSILPNSVELNSYTDTTNFYALFGNNTASSKTVKYYYFILGNTAI